jgi:hypothetical protein
VNEILERALATYARRWPALCAIFALAAIPSVLLQAAGEPAIARIVTAANALFAAGSADVAARARLLADFNAAIGAGGSTTLLVLLGLCALLLLAQTAAFADLSHALDGAPQSVAASYGRAAARWWTQVLVGLAFTVLSWLLAFAALPFFVLALALQALPLPPAVTGTALLVLTAAVGGGGLFAVALGYLAWLMAAASVATGDVPALAAVRAALRRTLEPAARRRTFVLAPMLVALNWSWSLATSVLAGAAIGLTHAGVLALVVPALGGIALDGLRSAAIAVYVRDAELHREGADLLAAAVAVPAAGPAGDDGLTTADRALIAQFLARSATLDPAAGAAIAARIAARVRPKLRASFHYLDDVALLEHLDRSRG